MKMAEWLKLSDGEKVSSMPDGKPAYKVTEDKGHCGYCGRMVSAHHFCFGCPSVSLFQMRRKTCS